MPKFNVRISITHDFEREVEFDTQAEADAWAQRSGGSVDFESDPEWEFTDATFEVVWVDEVSEACLPPHDTFKMEDV